MRINGLCNISIFVGTGSRSVSRLSDRTQMNHSLLARPLGGESSRGGDSNHVSQCALSFLFFHVSEIGSSRNRKGIHTPRGYTPTVSTVPRWLGAHLNFGKETHCSFSPPSCTHARARSTQSSAPVNLFFTFLNCCKYPSAKWNSRTKKSKKYVT